MKDIRVKTFTIDVDEYGNGSIEDDNTRGIRRAGQQLLSGRQVRLVQRREPGRQPVRHLGRRINNTEWEDPRRPTRRTATSSPARPRR